MEELIMRADMDTPKKTKAVSKQSVTVKKPTAKLGKMNEVVNARTAKKSIKKVLKKRKKTCKTALVKPLKNDDDINKADGKKIDNEKNDNEQNAKLTQRDNQNEYFIAERTPENNIVKRVKVQSSKDEIKTALIKRVKGYNTKEEVIEKALDEGEMKIVKQKTTLKHIPPDTGAIKLLLEMEGVLYGVENMSDEELFSMRERLMIELQNNNLGSLNKEENEKGRF